MDKENQFEKFPGKSSEYGVENLQKALEWENAMSEGVPEFAGPGIPGGMGGKVVKKAVEVGEKIGEKTFGNANEENEYYGEAKDDEGETGEEYDEGISDAAALINYGLNAAALKYGVETVVQKIKGFDASGSSDPIGDFFRYMGVDSPEKHKEVASEGEAFKENVEDFRESVNAPSNKRSTEGAFKAIYDMKELISEVEGADPRYEELRQGAKGAGKGYFEYAVSNFGVQGLTELFRVLAEQRERADAEENEEDSKKEMSEEEVEEKIEEIESNNNLSNEEKMREYEKLNPEILGH